MTDCLHNCLHAIVMASIYKPSNRKHFHTSFFVPTGQNKSKKVTRSTGETDRKKAQHVANSMEMSALDEVAANSSKSQAIMEIISQAKREAMKGTLNAVSGREYIREIVKISTGEDIPEYTIRTWTQEWFQRKESQSESTIRAYKTATNHFLKWLGDRADKPLESLTVPDMRAFRKWLLEGAGNKEKKASKTTVKLKMKVVSSIFIKAMAEGITNFNPTSALEPLIEDDKLERKPFTREEVSQLIESAPSEEWRGVITMGAYTGLRLTDCVLIEWGNVDLKGGIIKVIPRKTRKQNKEVTIPMHATLLCYLKRLPTPIKQEVKVFPSLSKHTGAGRNGLSRQFTRIMEQAGVSRGKSKKTGAKTTYEKSFHSLRHTFTSWLADSGIPPEVRKEILGQTSDDVHAIYTHFDLETLENAISTVPGL